MVMTLTQIMQHKTLEF